MGLFLNLACPFLSLPSLSVLLPTGIFWQSFLASFHPSTSPDISAVFWLGLSLLSTPAFTYISLLYFLCGPLKTRHIDNVTLLVSLEDGILVIGVTVGLWPLSANISFFPVLQLDWRSGRSGLTNRLVAPLLWGCFTGVSQGFLTPEYILSIALVSLRWISREKLTSPCWTRWQVGSG